MQTVVTSVWWNIKDTLLFYFIYYQESTKFYKLDTTLSSVELNISGIVTQVLDIKSSVLGIYEYVLHICENSIFNQKSHRLGNNQIQFSPHFCQVYKY